MTEQDTATNLPVEEQEVVEEKKEELEELTKGEEETEEQYGKKVQTRINKLTKKLREAEREFEKERDTYRKDFELMANNNRELKEAIDAMKQTASVIAEQTRPKPPDIVKEIDANIKSLRSKRAEALENADFKLLGIIDDQLDDLKDKRYEAKLNQELLKEREQIEKKVTETKKDNGDVNPVIEAWVDDTPWYNDRSREYDPAMKAAAIAIHDIVINDHAWSNKTLRQQLAETKRRTEAKFGYGKKEQPPPSVEGVDSMSTGMKTPTILTDDQKYVAVRMFPNLTPKDAEKKYSQYLNK